MAGHTAYAAPKGGINALTLYTAAPVRQGRNPSQCHRTRPHGGAKNLTGPLGDLMLRHHLTPRLGNPENIDAMVIFLCSYGGGFVTGQVLKVDGGLDSHLPHVADPVALQTQ